MLVDENLLSEVSKSLLIWRARVNQNVNESSESNQLNGINKNEANNSLPTSSALNDHVVEPFKNGIQRFDDAIDTSYDIMPKTLRPWLPIKQSLLNTQQPTNYTKSTIQRQAQQDSDYLGVATNYSNNYHDNNISYGSSSTINHHASTNNNASCFNITPYVGKFAPSVYGKAYGDDVNTMNNPLFSTNDIHDALNKQQHQQRRYFYSGGNDRNIYNSSNNTGNARNIQYNHIVTDPTAAYAPVDFMNDDVTKPSPQLKRKFQAFVNEKKKKIKKSAVTTKTSSSSSSSTTNLYSAQQPAAIVIPHETYFQTNNNNIDSSHHQQQYITKREYDEGYKLVQLLHAAEGDTAFYNSSAYIYNNDNIIIGGDSAGGGGSSGGVMNNEEDVADETDNADEDHSHLLPSPTSTVAAAINMSVSYGSNSNSNNNTTSNNTSSSSDIGSNSNSNSTSIESNNSSSSSSSNSNAAVKKRKNYAARRSNSNGTWSTEDDDKLKQLIQKYGSHNWDLISKSIPGRTGKQCRERWHNQLDTRIVKADWTEAEDAMIQLTHEKLGNQWAKITKYLPGRTDNAVKNRFHLLCRRAKRLKKKEDGMRMCQQRMDDASKRLQSLLAAAAFTEEDNDDGDDEENRNEDDNDYHNIQN